MRSPPPLVFAIAALAAVAPDAFPPAVLVVFAIVTLPWNFFDRLAVYTRFVRYANLCAKSELDVKVSGAP
jgi:hypothetical protein